MAFEKVDPTFSSFNPFQSLPSIAKDDRKQFHCLIILLNNINEPLFLKFNRCEKRFSF